MRNAIKYKLNVLLFTMPALILFSVMVTYPVLQSVYKSLFNWDGLSQPVFVGFKNYIKLFQNDNFYLANANGFIFAVMITFYQIGLGLLLALVLASKKISNARFFRTSYFLPVVISSVIAGQLWLQIYNPDYGLINKFLEFIGVSYRQAWLNDPKYAIYAVSFVNAWQFMGVHLVLIYTALKSIPEHYYEAAVIDGASTLTAHGVITLPLLGETFKFCLVITITSGLKAFNEMYVMTGGGPGTYTNTLTYLMYKQAFMANNFGYGCTVATILVLECLFFTILINRFIARERIVY